MHRSYSRFSQQLHRDRQLWLLLLPQNRHKQHPLSIPVHSETNQLYPWGPSLLLALAGSGSTTWAGGRDQKLVGRAGQTVAVSGCPLSSMSPPPQAGSEGREKPCRTRPGPTRPGPGPPPSPHPLSRPLFHPDSLPDPGCSWLPSHCQGPCLPGEERQRQGAGRAEAS
jgi:hypothetical protein